MQKWEYKVLTTHPEKDEEALKALEDSLNQQGEAGWESFVAQKWSGAVYLVIFKRPKVDALE